MTMYMLDTDICSYAIKRRSAKLLDRLSAIPPSDICLSVISRAELLYGLQQLPTSHRLQIEVRYFLKSMRVLAWDEDAADYYATIRHQLISSGQPIGSLDTMIAAHSLAAGAILVTNNARHFRRIAQPLALENWTV